MAAYWFSVWPRFAQLLGMRNGKNAVTELKPNPEAAERAPVKLIDGSKLPREMFTDSLAWYTLFRPERTELLSLIKSLRSVDGSMTYWVTGEALRTVVELARTGNGDQKAIAVIMNVTVRLWIKSCFICVLRYEGRGFLLSTKCKKYQSFLAI